jgi:hypothetical protein
MLLFATPVQRNAPAILSHSFDRRAATLIRGSPICGLSNLGEFFLVSIQPSELFHSFRYRVSVDGVRRMGRARLREFEARNPKYEVFEQEQTELTESVLKISVSSVASCEEVANLTLASQHFSPQAWEVLPRDSVFSFMERTSSS